MVRSPSSHRIHRNMPEPLSLQQDDPSAIIGVGRINSRCWVVWQDALYFWDDLMR